MVPSPQLYSLYPFAISCVNHWILGLYLWHPLCLSSLKRENWITFILYIYLKWKPVNTWSWPAFPSCGAARLLCVELIRLLIVASEMFVHSWGNGGPGLAWLHMVCGCVLPNSQRHWKWLIIVKWTLNSLATALVDTPAASTPIRCSFKPCHPWYRVALHNKTAHFIY